MRSKIKWLVLLFAISLAACNNGPNAWNHFKEKYADKGTTIRLNGLMRMGLSLFANTDHDPDAREIMNILKKMKGVEINIIPESKAHFSSGDVNHLSDLLNKSRYESLVSVRKGNQMVNLWAKGDKNTFSDPLALIHDGNEVIMVEMKGTLTTNDIQTITRAGMKYAK